MARRSRGRNADTIDIANSPSYDLMTELLRPVEPLPLMVSRLDEFTQPDLPFDRRVFSFGEPERYSLTVREALKSETPSRPFNRMAGVERLEQKIPVSSVGGVGFHNPATVAVCHRREVRREVLFAKKRRGRGGARRRSWHSEIRC